MKINLNFWGYIVDINPSDIIDMMDIYAQQFATSVGSPRLYEKMRANAEKTRSEIENELLQWHQMLQAILDKQK